MDGRPELTPEIEKTLAKYLDLQQMEKRLAAEKASLQEILIQHLLPYGSTIWSPLVAGQYLKVNYKASVVVNYNEKLLQERLGARYARILKPDIAKLRRNLALVEPLLQPELLVIGSPHRDKVRSAILDGTVAREEFEGAFEKTTKHFIAVVRPGPRRDDAQGA